MAPEPSHRLKIIALAGLLGLAVLVLHFAGVTRYFTPENIGKLEAAIRRLGIWGPLAYIALYVAVCLFFLPGIPITLLAGVFGAGRGTLLASIGSILGASAAFLVARYAFRPMVERWAENNPTFKKIDDGVKREGWRMVMITRLVPLFPYNLQNYAYGLTRISFPTYFLVSWICMLPGTIAYVFAGGSIVSGGGNMKKTFLYLSVAAVIFVLLSFLPRLLKKSNATSTRP